MYAIVLTVAVRLGVASCDGAMIGTSLGANDFAEVIYSLRFFRKYQNCYIDSDSNTVSPIHVHKEHPSFLHSWFVKYIFCVQQANRPTNAAKLQIINDINDIFTEINRPTTRILYSYGWIKQKASGMLRKMKNQRKPTKNQRKRTASNRNQRPSINIIPLIINYIYINKHEKSRFWLVGWSVGRHLCDFSKLVNKNNF